MTWQEYRGLRLVDMQERRWRLVRSIRNGYIEVPAGREVEITGKRNGLAIAAEACECCGVRVFMTRVDPQALEEVA